MQNIIAVIWDFDKTLISSYMQDPIFKEYKVDASTFWNEVNELPQKYKDKGIKVNPDTIYLNHFLHYIKNGKFKELNNKKLNSYGSKQVFYEGIPEIFETTTKLFEKDPVCKEYNITVEHYIVSTGFAEVIKGTSIMKYVKRVWGCEMIEDSNKNGITELSEIGYTIDNTTKTRALFEISKGVNDENDIDVNSKLTYEQRRVDFKNMIYIADGPSDVPAFSVVKSNGGSTFAIYPKGNEKAFEQVERLRMDGRIDMFAEANYSDGTTASMWICNKIKEFGERIKNSEQEKRKSYNKSPRHLV